MEKLSCLTCQVSWPSAADQREHYKSEWHLYNLKRRLASFKPITENEFDQIKEKHCQPETGPESKLPLYCRVCGKSFLNQKAFDQHNASNRHQKQFMLSEKISHKIKQEKTQKPEIVPVPAAVKIPAEPEIEVEEEFNEDDWEEIDSDEEEEPLESIPVDECLFCEEKSDDIEQNLAHMSRQHSFFIPDLEYCADISGLLDYLGTKIAAGHCCLWCSDHGKRFGTKKSAQQHMMDSGHTKINFHHRQESLVEFGDFYDYSASYPEVSAPNDQDKDDEKEEEEADDVELTVLEPDEDYQLKLPSGAVIGHRSLMIYYRQKLQPQKPTTAPEQKPDRRRNQELIHRLGSHYRTLGWNLSNGADAGSISAQYAKDMHRMNRLAQKFRLKVAIKNNINMQSHFRPQTGFK